MADTNFVNQQTIFQLAWTQAINDAAYRGRDLTYATSTGSANVFTLTLASSLKVAFVAGDQFTFKAHQANTVGASTFVLVTSLGTLNAPISYAGSTTLPTGIIPNGQTLTLTYDGVNMQMPYVGTTLSVDTAQIVDHAVTYVKLQTVNSNSIVANPSGSPTTASDTPVVAPLAFVAGSLVNNTPLAQCRLTLVATALTLSRFYGSYIWINGQNQIIPEAGITLAIGAAVASTAYYIYVFMSGSTMTLEFSATAPAIDTTSGMPIKTADATRTLVGLAFTNNPAAWADTVTKRWVLSFWNRREKGFNAAFTTNRTDHSTVGYLEIDTEIRVQFISWSDELVKAWADGFVSANNNNAVSSTTMGLDSSTVAQDCSNKATQGGADSNHNFPVSLALPPRIVSEGVNHFLTLLGFTAPNTDTSTWGGGGSGARTSLKGIVMG